MIFSVARPLPKLRSLVLDKCFTAGELTTMGSNALGLLVPCCPGLQHLSVQACLQLEASVTVMRQLVQLQAMKLDVMADHLEQLIHLSTLRALDISIPSVAFPEIGMLTVLSQLTLLKVQCLNRSDGYTSNVSDGLLRYFDCCGALLLRDAGASNIATSHRVVCLP